MPRAKTPPATPAIAAKLHAAGDRVYRRREVGDLLRTCRAEHLVSQRLTLDEFTAFLADTGLLTIASIKPPLGSAILRYHHGELSPFELGLTLRDNAYLSHGSAAFLHGLNDQLPSVVYVNREQSPKPEPTGPLLQANVDRAFAHPQRTSKYVFELAGTNTSFVLLSGKHTGKLGVVDVRDPYGRSVACTDLERTLVDMVVRPTYAGGVAQVLESFANARGRVSVPKLVATLEELGHFYPYHQALGFYMSRAGYEDGETKLLRRFGLAIDFYLVHAMQRMEFDASWRVYVPRGL